MRFVTRHGGKVEQNYRAGVTSLYVETGLKIKARNMVAMRTVDVVAGKWALEAGWRSKRAWNLSRTCGLMML